MKNEGSTVDYLQFYQQHVEGLKHVGKGEWKGHCPFGENHSDGKDSNPSFYINEHTGQYICQACKMKGNVITFCREKKIPPHSGVIINSNKSKHSKRWPDPEAIFDYQDENGKTLYQVCRFPGKEFKQRRPDNNGKWIYQTKDIRKVPYHLPELLKANSDDWVWIPEGEKHCDRLNKLGLIATCNVGGAEKWTSELNPYLKDRKVCILPDNDDPGQKHGEKVAYSLNKIAKEIRILNLPGLGPKGDVANWLDAGHTKEELIELTEKTEVWKPAKPKQYKSFQAIVQRNGELYRRKQKATGVDELHIASFSIKPLESIWVDGEGETLRVRLKAGSKDFEVLFYPDIWASTQKFMRALPSKETAFIGSIADVQLIRVYLSDFEMPHRKGIKIAGYHNGIFITEEGALSTTGVTKDLVYLNETPSNCKLLSTEPATPDELKLFRDRIHGFNIPTVSLPILGWTIACFFKPVIMEILQEMGLGNGFPLLDAQGEAGAGKTRTVNDILMRIWAIIANPVSISELTQFTLMKAVDERNCIPLVLEENKGCLQNDCQKSMISNLIRATYNSLQGARGRADQTTQVYQYQAPVVIVGETGFIEPALLDRFITVFMAKKDSAPYLQNFKELQKLPLEKLGRSVLETALKMGRQDIKAILQEEYQAVDLELKDRPRANSAICRFGLRILENLLEMDFDLPKIDEAVKEGLLEGDSIHRKSAVDRILEAMCLMSAGSITKGYEYQEHLEAGTDFEIDKGILKLYVTGAYPKFKKWAKSYSFEGDLLPETTFKKQLQKEDYFFKQGPLRIGGETKWGFTLNVQKMKEKGLELTQSWNLDLETEEK